MCVAFASGCEGAGLPKACGMYNGAYEKKTIQQPLPLPPPPQQGNRQQNQQLANEPESGSREDENGKTTTRYNNLRGPSCFKGKIAQDGNDFGVVAEWYAMPPGWVRRLADWCQKLHKTIINVTATTVSQQANNKGVERMAKVSLVSEQQKQKHQRQLNA